MSRLWRDRLLRLARARGGRAGARDGLARKRARSIVASRRSTATRLRRRALARGRGHARRRDEPLRRERMNVTVVLSNHFVRYAVVPFDSAVSGASEEELALARFHFTKIHGERAKGWEVRMSEGRAARRAWQAPSMRS